MSLLKRLFICNLLNVHRPIRGKVRWDGLNYVGHCKNCGKSVRRNAHKNKLFRNWSSFNHDQDHSVEFDHHAGK